MKTRALALALLFAVVLTLSLGLLACGGSEDSSAMQESEQAAATAAPAAARAAPAATTAPAARPVAREESESTEEDSSGSSTGFYQNTPLTDEALSSLVTQTRVIVRTVDIGIIVPNVPGAKGDIALLAEDLGGWEVTSERTQRHEARVSVRVPAELLSQFLQRLKDMAVEVEYENSTSQDVTADFVDNEARLKVLKGTEARLLEFHSRAVNVEETVNLEAELSRVQLEIEGIQGRLRFMAETSAYSLVNVALTTEPGTMPVEIGSDATYRAGVNAKFQAVFRPPSGVDEFRFIWDFGDGSQKVDGTRTASTTNTGERVTATVSHTFTNVEESPYIVQLEIRGIGDTGLFWGRDTLIATVTEIPGIEVFAGDDRVVDEGDEVEYSGSFTRPEGLWDFRYRWDFGDGSATIFEVPEEGETRAVAMHTFPDYRPDPYQAVLTVIAQSEAGEIRGSSTFNVTVNEVEGFVVAGFDIGGAAKQAVRALTAIGQGFLIVLLWVGILSPVWLGIIAAFILVPRIVRWFGRRFGGSMPSLSTSLSNMGGPWQTDRPLTPPAGRGNIDTQFESDFSTDATPTQQPEDDFTDADIEEQPTIICPSCNAVYPAINEMGQPARFCPSCGTVSPMPEDTR